ncbi:hypothetical protein Salat_2983700 [Sesamum alatum]|uniref:Uncharacterized protein n=1 Tax=Sesamum alatum TaxID=300844 RepID=A0AAE1XIZ0_9LAMI|nr:hypothetical protein Salat_2983700 [Sesamum alatum]
MTDPSPASVDAPVAFSSVELAISSSPDMDPDPDSVSVVVESLLSTPLAFSRAIQSLFLSKSFAPTGELAGRIHTLIQDSATLGRYPTGYQGKELLARTHFLSNRPASSGTLLSTGFVETAECSGHDDQPVDLELRLGLPGPEIERDEAPIPPNHEENSEEPQHPPVIADVFPERGDELSGGEAVLMKSKALGKTAL